VYQYLNCNVQKYAFTTKLVRYIHTHAHVPDMTYNVFGGTLNLAQSINTHLLLAYLLDLCYVKLHSESTCCTLGPLEASALACNMPP